MPLRQLDSLWFQVTGTLCNLTCTHCFISCAPANHSFGFLDYQTVLRALEESKSLGVKEYYFTGGEPFLHPRLLDMIDATLQIGPATILTNGTLLSEKRVQSLAASRDRSIYSLELRVSIDAPDAETNDTIRGAGAFGRAMDGVRLLVNHGFLPIVTMAQTSEDADLSALYQRMRDVLIAVGYGRPRVKILPTLRIGAEALRSRGYGDDERVTTSMMEGYDDSHLLCATSRTITARGVHVCPILIEAPDSILSQSLADSTKTDYPLHHPACHTCWLHGAICSNFSGIAGKA